MINLRKAIVDIQRLENSAAEKIGMRLLLMEDARLYGNMAKAYIDGIVDQMIRDCEDEIADATRIGKMIGEAVGADESTPGSEFVAFFKLAATTLIKQMADRLRIKIARNKAIGVEADVIAEWRRDPKSVLNIERFNLTKALKKEMAGVLNRVFQAQITKAYRNG